MIEIVLCHKFSENPKFDYYSQAHIRYACFHFPLISSETSSELPIYSSVHLTVMTAGELTSEGLGTGKPFPSLTLPNAG